LCNLSSHMSINNSIPNILWQCWKTKHIPEPVKSSVDSWSKSNPGLQKKFMDDDQCSSFILEHFGPAVHKDYIALPQNIMRADFWRIAVVYVHGGYYADLDVECNVPVEQLVHSTSVNSVFTVEYDNIANFFFGATAGHPILKTTLDQMIKNAKNINQTSAQNFGMHPLHVNVREYVGINGVDYVNSDQVCFLPAQRLREEKKLIHQAVSGNLNLPDYASWRRREQHMLDQRTQSQDVRFFTTFNKNGYDLYGQQWIQSFIDIANYYNKFKATIYHEGFEPTTQHPNVTWIKYETAMPNHPKWKTQYLKQSSHSDYVKKMTVRFSHKAFVIQHALQNNSDEYLIWLDGDCVFKKADYSDFPKTLLSNKFLACQIEHSQYLNHVESGILIFDNRHPATQKFVKKFSKNYQIKHILSMSQPYDGFVIFKSLAESKLDYIDLNLGHGKGGIQSDPGMTFCNPAIKDKFIHNIGWTGKNQYENWDTVFGRDDIYKTMTRALFGNDLHVKKQKAFTKLNKLKSLTSS